jgi:hypothetical protein
VLLCPFVKSGIMHKEFQKYLKPDGLGIDYTQLTNYDTMSKLSRMLKQQHPIWIQKIEESIATMNKKDLRDALRVAKTIGLAEANPELMKRGQQALGEKVL